MACERHANCTKMSFSLRCLMCHLNFLSLADVDFESPDDSPLRSKSLPDCAQYRHNLDAQKHVFS